MGVLELKRLPDLQAAGRGGFWEDSFEWLGLC